MGKESQLDTFFICHGLAWLGRLWFQQLYKEFLESWSEKILPEKPKYILVISGHYKTTEPSINAPDLHETMHDIDDDLPAEYHKMKYPARGSPELATMVNDALIAADYKPVHVDTNRGLDHGAWEPLMLMYPEADIPVGQLSLQFPKDGAYYLNLGKALAPLRKQGVLILCTGHVTAIIPSDTMPPWAIEFDNYVKDAVLEGRYDDVSQALEKYPRVKIEHPAVVPHFLPLLVAIGAAGGEKAKAQLIHQNYFCRYTVSSATYSFSSTDDE